jgi:hypothetical protein
MWHVLWRYLGVAEKRISQMKRALTCSSSAKSDNYQDAAAAHLRIPQKTAIWSHIAIRVIDGFSEDCASAAL